MVIIGLFCGMTVLSCYLFYLLFQLWQSGKRLFRASGDFTRAFSEFAQPHLKDYLRAQSVYLDPARKESARHTRQNIKTHREIQRKKRLAAATTRWEQNSAANFANIDAAAHKRAQQYRRLRARGES